MENQFYGEADTRAKLVTPMLIKRGWGEDAIRREETDRAIEFGMDGRAHRGRRQADYLLSIFAFEGAQPVPVALIEAKKESKPPAHGIEQVKEYARKCPRFNVPFLYATNGHLFVEFDRASGKFAGPFPAAKFPTPDELRARYEKALGFSLNDAAAAPLLRPYSGGSGKPRYYQDAAIRAVMEKLAIDAKAGQPARVLLSMATGAGKTFVAANLLRRIREAGKLARALFLCDRVALRDQALAHFRKEFSDEVAIVEEVRGRNLAKNAQVHIATYQTLGVDRKDGEGGDDGAAYHRLYPNPDHFSHIVIDECHRSAWDKWSLPLTRNPNAAHIGLTATPREFKAPVRVKHDSDLRADFLKDWKITAHNLKYFHEPAYEYSIGQGGQDGYLAACTAGFLRANLDIRGLTKAEVAATRPVDPDDGEIVDEKDIAQKYDAPQFEREILLPDRVREMCRDLFDRIIHIDGGPDQKTIIFCADIDHAASVVREMQNLRAEHAEKQNQRPPENYAFQCVGESNGSRTIPDFKSNLGDFFVAATVDLLSTGVDVPPVRHIAFFRYLKSPILFRQMIGRGTRIHKETDKLAFCVHDYTGAFSLLGEDLTVNPPPKEKKGEKTEPPTDPERRRRLLSEGHHVQVMELASAILTRGESGERWMPLHEYKREVAAKMAAEVRNISKFRCIWTNPARRVKMIESLKVAGFPPQAAKQMEECEEQDLFDYLAQLAWDADPKTRRQRAEQFRQNNAEWLRGLKSDTAAVINAIIAVFEDGGTDQLESRSLFAHPEVAAAGGVSALENETMTEIKRRLFAN